HAHLFSFLLTISHHPRSTLFPYTTLFRSQMQLGMVSENVVVSADASQLESATSDIGSTVQSSLVANLPLEVSGTIRNPVQFITRSEEHTSELQSRFDLVCRLLLEKKKKKK